MGPAGALARVPVDRSKSVFYSLVSTPPSAHPLKKDEMLLSSPTENLTHCFTKSQI